MNQRSFGPIETYSGFDLSSINYDQIITEHLSFLFWVAIKEYGTSIVDSVLSCLGGIEGNIVKCAYFFIEFIEGTIELILFAKGVSTDEIEMAGMALYECGGSLKAESKSSYCY